MVNINKLRLTNLQNEILRLLFINAGIQLNAHRIAKLLNVSQPAISKALPLLEKESLIIVKKDSISKRLSIELNRDDTRALWLKRVDNIKQIYDSGLVQFIRDQLPEVTVILFGSYSNGEDTIHSDIDLAIIGTRYKGLDLKKFEKILERDISINNYESFKKIDKHILNNVLNGIVLKGAVEI
ncbi:MAG: nucleotidyltransferase domain-containing protein [Candidatus Woesearchaeota archaeon]